MRLSQYIAHLQLQRTCSIALHVCIEQYDTVTHLCKLAGSVNAEGCLDAAPLEIIVHYGCVCLVRHVLLVSTDTCTHSRQVEHSLRLMSNTPRFCRRPSPVTSTASLNHLVHCKTRALYVDVHSWNRRYNDRLAKNVEAADGSLLSRVQSYQEKSLPSGRWLHKKAFTVTSPARSTNPPAQRVTSTSQLAARSLRHSRETKSGATPA